MKKLILILTLLLLAACSNKEEKIENSVIIEKEPEKIQIKSNENYDIDDIRGKTFKNNSEDKYYFTFLEDALLITIPQFAIEKELKCTYENGSFVVEVFTGNYLEGKEEKDKLTSVESFFIYRILDSISHEENYINKENHKALFTYTYILEKEILKINPNSSNQVLFTKEK